MHRAKHGENHEADRGLHSLMSIYPAWCLIFSDVRIEECLYEKLEKKANPQMNNHEMLGQSMIESGSEFGPGTTYVCSVGRAWRVQRQGCGFDSHGGPVRKRNALIKCGETETLKPSW